jgi:hypothetical protein
MVGRDGKKLQFLAQQASAVSHALWPANVRKGVATGKSAQRRRFMIINASWWPEFLQVAQVLLPLALVFISMVIGGAMVAALTLSVWYLLLVPLTLVVMFLMVLFIVAYRVLKVDWRHSFQVLWRFHDMDGSDFFLKDELETPFPIGPSSPETPMPEPNPFVRILETYDLSSSDVEHFLLADAEEQEMETAEYPIYQSSLRHDSSF